MTKTSGEREEYRKAVDDLNKLTDRHKALQDQFINQHFPKGGDANATNRHDTRTATSPGVTAGASAPAGELVDWIAVAQSGFRAWQEKPHNARWFRKIDGTPIPNDLTICIGEAFATALRAKDEEIARLTERLGPRGLEVVMIDGSGHYVSEKVAATIRRLEETLVLSERQTTEQARVKELREALERIRTYGGDYTTDQPKGKR